MQRGMNMENIRLFMMVVNANHNKKPALPFGKRAVVMAEQN
jgi:hypothetical protein